MCLEKQREKSGKVKLHKKTSRFWFSFSGCKKQGSRLFAYKCAGGGEPQYSAMHSNFLLKICSQSSCRNQLQIPNLKMKVTWLNWGRDKERKEARAPNGAAINPLGPAAHKHCPGAFRHLNPHAGCTPQQLNQAPWGSCTGMAVYENFPGDLNKEPWLSNRALL